MVITAQLCKITENPLNYTLKVSGFYGIFNYTSIKLIKRGEQLSWPLPCQKKAKHSPQSRQTVRILSLMSCHGGEPRGLWEPQAPMPVLALKGSFLEESTWLGETIAGRATGSERVEEMPYQDSDNRIHTMEGSSKANSHLVLSLAGFRGN